MMNRLGMLLLGVAVLGMTLGLVTTPATHASFSYLPAGDLIPGSGDSAPETAVIHVTDMRFPIEKAPAYANSPVYGVGGYYGPPGSQCAASNYDYPWRDNFCETRPTNRTCPMCPKGYGHQGQDIRPSTCEDDTHWAVAAENGTIYGITAGKHYLVLQGVSGVHHSYLHMSMDKLVVQNDDYVTKGQRLGLVSDDFGGTSTHIHLHYNMRKHIDGYGLTYVNPYMNLVDAYQSLIAGTPEDSGVCVQQAFEGAEDQLFVDVIPSDSARKYIEAMANAGITTGCGGDFYCPDCPLSRAMAAAFTVRAAGMDTSNVPATPTFNDVPVDAWYYPYVETIAAAGIAQGCDVPAGLFCPNAPITREQMAKLMILGSLMPTVTPATPTFNDVDPDLNWSYPYVEALAAHCVVGGCNEAEGLFCPTDIVTRRVAAFFVARTFDLTALDGEDLNSCVEYCDPATCTAAPSCTGWDDCTGFSDQCDETGTESRACFTSECTGTPTNGTCSSDENTESQECTRDTDGEVTQGWGAWSACGGFDSTCDTGGTRSRTRTVCEGGAETVKTQSEACTQDTDGVVVVPWGDWSTCDGFDGPCDTTGTQAHTQTVCSGGVEAEQSESQGCTRETDGEVVTPWGEWPTCDGFDGPCDTTGTQAHTQTVCSGGVEAEQSESQGCTREVSCPEADADDAGPEEGDVGASDIEQAPGPGQADGSTEGTSPKDGWYVDGGDAGQPGTPPDSGDDLPSEPTVPDASESTQSAGCQQGARGPLASWMVGVAMLLLLSGIRRRQWVRANPRHGRATSRA